MEQIKKLIESNDLDSAEKRIEQLRSRDGNNNDLTFLMGVVYLKKNNIDNALAIFSMLAAGNSKDYRSLFNIGLIHEKKGNKEYAQEMYEAVIALKPDHKLALGGLKRLIKHTDDLIQTNAVEPGKLMFEWSPKPSSSSIYYFYAFAFLLPVFFILINLIFFNFEVIFLNIFSGFCGLLSLFCIPYAVWCIASALRMDKSKYKIYENTIEVKICEGFSIKHNIIAMYNIDNIELKSSFPLTLIDGAYIAIPYEMDSNGVMKKYNLFTYENYEKTKSVFDYIRMKSINDKQEVNTLKR